MTKRTFIYLDRSIAQLSKIYSTLADCLKPCDDKIHSKLSNVVKCCKVLSNAVRLCKPLKIL
jgi:hypothetical protein